MTLRSALAAALLSATPLHAQAAIEQLFSQTEAVTISGSLGCVNSSTVTANDGDCGIYSFGLEALINLAESREGRPWGVELALGYGQTSGFRSANPDLDLRGAVRALPSVAAYASRDVNPGLGIEAAYVGVHTGFLSLHHMRAYDAEGREFEIAGETFEFGVSVGLYHGSGFFVEPSYRIRYFSSVDWTMPDGVEALPAGWPRSLNLSGPTLSMGYQFSIGGEEEAPPES